jgi:nicotinamidase-related amidase
MGKVLIVIDLQTGFFDPKNSWYVPGIESMLPVIKHLCKGWPATDRLFTKFVNIHPQALKDEAGKFVPGSDEASLYQEVKALALEENVFEKNGYSVFKNAKLLDRIEQAETIYLCGVEADACVLYSLAEAYDLTLPVYVIEDAIAGFGVFKDRAGYKKYIRDHFGERLVNSQELLDFYK